MIKRSYTRCFAWIPTRTSSGRVLWLQVYYIRPPINSFDSEGVLLSYVEYLLESSL